MDNCSYLCTQIVFEYKNQGLKLKRYRLSYAKIKGHEPRNEEKILVYNDRRNALYSCNSYQL